MVALLEIDVACGTFLRDQTKAEDHSVDEGFGSSIEVGEVH